MQETSDTRDDDDVPSEDAPADQPPAEATDQMRFSDALDRNAAARGALYGLCATLFREPDESVHERLATGAVTESAAELVAASGLDLDAPALGTDDDHDTLCARYNDLFTVGYAEYEDRTDGSLDAQGPPVSLYESRYRSEVSWNDVNLDLARAYDYFGVEVDQETRDNHDFLPYMLEFAGYLARQEAVAAEADRRDLARARLDFLDRHLRVAVSGVADAMAGQDGTELYGALAAFCDALSRADQQALAERCEETHNPPEPGGDDP
ncbi:molecular chaperone TorD family protein [Haloarchaeobius amylolyticus]|uniref:molecular chaperone TorD family protein n=1 Tax=Haloarchaeobius amylolyticus TaxID=1198296 RepID=UPI0022717249|nr:molecular chaperone TorD family protein [Haloarchaeobius amylolyticus]